MCINVYNVGHWDGVGVIGITCVHRIICILYG